jgi:DNA-binding SARP family transcriptional activator
MRLRTFGGLWLEDTAGKELTAIRPRPLALLAILASATPRGVSRERLLGILWPDAAEDRGRHAMAQSVYGLRRILGDTAVTGSSELRLDANVVHADVAEFLDAIARDDCERAARLYAGPFLDGFYLGDVSEFERWVETERARLHRLAIGAIERLARSTNAPASWKRLTELDPLDSRFAADYMASLVSGGDRVAALSHARAHESVVRRELEAEPNADVLRLADELRFARAPRRSAPARAPVEALHVAEVGDVAADAPTTNGGSAHAHDGDLAPASNGKRPRMRGRRLVSLAVATTMIAAVAVWLRATTPEQTVSAAETESEASARAGTTSPIAHRFYEEGLHAYHQFDNAGTQRLMESALRVDSGFAMAAYYAWLSGREIDRSEGPKLRDRLMRLASHASDQQRLLMIGMTRVAEENPSAVAASESLSIRFPSDEDGQNLHGFVSRMRGDYRAAAVAYQRAAALDSARSVAPGAVCRACVSLSGLFWVYLEWDSLPAAERALRSWMALRPRTPEPLWTLAELRWRQSRWSDADDAMQTAAAVDVRKPAQEPALYRAAIRRGTYDQLGRDAAAAIRDPNRERRTEARWMWLIALRNQGRLREALAFVRDGRLPDGRSIPRSSLADDEINRAILAFETGDFRTAARIYRKIAQQSLTIDEPGHRFRGGSWNLTLAGMAEAAAGDTAAVTRLADSVEAMGAQSLFGRGSRLHHFLRGLQLANSGRHAEAVDAYRRAVVSWTHGYTRINYEMARSLIALNRPGEAVYPLQAALRGAIDASNLYVTRTELHELLAQAFAASGQRDSAAANYRDVARAWSRADPAFESRRRYAVTH